MKYRLRQNAPSKDIHTCIQEILRQRGVKNIEGYMYPSKKYENDPFLLDNVRTATDRLLEHVRNKSSILIITDADTDGYCSASILWLYLKDFFPDIDLKFICHEHKAHGLEDIIDDIENAGFDLVLIPDAGSGDEEYYQRLKNIGTECIYIDHHEAETYCLSAIGVNNQLSANYPNKSLCGAGVIYKFCQVLDSILSPENPRAPYYLDLVALAEIADCMSPQNPETQYYITEGLKHINNQFFKTLIEAQSYSLFKVSQDLNYIKIAFYIAPIINAMVRVGSMEEKRQMFLAFIEPNLLIQSEKRGAKEGDMVDICSEVVRKATNAKARQNRIKDKATELLDARIQKEGLLDNKILIIEVKDKDNIPQELRGLIAAQFTNKYHRPAMIGKVNDEGYFRGSLRGSESFAEVPDFKAFLDKSGLMEQVAGHANAAGISIKKSLISDLIDYANNHISDAGLDNIYDVDYIFKASEDFAQLGLILASNENYWGNEIKEPTLVVERIPFNSRNVMLMGEKKDSVKISYNGVDYIRFKDEDFAQLISGMGSGDITVYGRTNKNVYYNKTSLQVFIDDYEVFDTKFDF